VGADLAADDRRARDDQRRGPRDMRREGEVQPGHPVDDRGEDVLERVRALQALRQCDAEHAEQQDPLGRAEVAAVDARGEDADRGPDPALVLAAHLALGQRPVDPRLQDDEHQRDGDEHRDDGLERRCR